MSSLNNRLIGLVWLSASILLILWLPILTDSIHGIFSKSGIMGALMDFIASSILVVAAVGSLIMGIRQVFTGKDIIKSFWINQIKDSSSKPNSKK